MNQDIKTTNSSVSNYALDEDGPLLSLTTGQDPATTLPGVFKALNSDMALSTYEELKDWLKSDLDDESSKTSLISPELIRAKRNIQAALVEAELEVQKFALNRDLKQAKQVLQAARNARFDSERVAQSAIDEASAKQVDIEKELRMLGIPKYAKTTKALRNYAQAVLSYAEKLSDGERDKIVRDAVIDLESRLMPKVDNIYMGVPGRMEALGRIQLKMTFDAVARLHELEKHLHGRSMHIDMDQETRIQNVASNPIVKEVLDRADELPKDGAVFFIKDGRMVRVPNGNTPLMIDVSRMSLGMGKEGAGLFRFIGQEAEIDGAAVIKLKLKNGKPIPLKGSDPSNPKYAKEVAELIGKTPEWLQIGITFGEVVKKFAEPRPAEATAEAAPKETES